MPQNPLKSSMLERMAPVMLIALIGLAFLVGVLWQKVENISKGGTPTVAGTQAAQPTPAPVKVDIAKIKDLFNKDLIKFGSGDKKLLFVEIADPSCPYCSIAAGKNPELNKSTGQFTLVSDGGTYVAPVPEMKKLVDQGKASFVWIYSPGHGNGEMGTKAMYCAQEKGKFWEVHDVLMSSKGYDLLNNTIKNDKTKSGDLADFLKGAIDAGFLKGCLDSGKYDQRLGNDIAVARSLGVSGTPGFFVNENNFAGAYSFKDMESLVSSALK